MKSQLISLALVVGIAGCAAPSLKPPSDQSRDFSERHSAEFDGVWEGVVDWFAVTNIPIKNIDKNSGLISSDYSLGSNFTQVDCGDMDPGDMARLVDTNITANINVLVRRQQDGVVVRPNVFGQGVYTLQSTWDGRLIYVRADRCVSTGELENSLQNYLRARF